MKASVLSFKSLRLAIFSITLLATTPMVLSADSGQVTDHFAAAKKKKNKKNRGKKVVVKVKADNDTKKYGKILGKRRIKVKRGGNVIVKAKANPGYRAGLFVDGSFLAASKESGLFKHKLKKVKDSANVTVKFVGTEESFTEVLNMAFFGLGAQEFVTTEETYTFSIQAETDSDVPVQEIKWFNKTTGASGSATQGDSGWEAPITLSKGDNDLLFRLIAADWSEENREMIVVRHDQEFFAAPLQVSDEIIFSNATEDDTKLRFHVALLGTSDDISVSLIKVNEKGFKIGGGDNLLDDGTLPDEIAKDGVFTADIEMPVSEPGFHYYRAEVTTELGTYQSQIVRVWVTDPLSSLDIDALVAVSNQLKSLYENAIAEGKSSLQAYAEAATTVEAMPSVDKAGGNPSTGLWAVTNRGLLAAYNPIIPGRRGGQVSDSTRAATTPKVQSIGALNDDNSIFSRQGVIVSPYINHPNADESKNIDSGDDLFGPWGELPTDSKNCQLAASEQIVNNGSKNVTLDSYKNIGQFGVIHFSTHGSNLFFNLIRDWQDSWGPKDLFRGTISKVALDSGVQMTQSDGVWDYAAVERDLLLKRIALAPDSTFLLLPTFFQKYLEALPNSLVVLSSCRSMANRSLADAFLSKGAGGVIGFSDYVTHTFAQDFVSHVYSQMVNGADAQSAFNSATANVGTNDGAASPVLVGDSPSTLVFPDGASIFNGGFERGFTPWVRDGDGRRLGRLGQTEPVSGSYLGIISTGLGYSEASGAMYQEICVDEDAQLLDFWWNFFSEEFLEYCGSQYQDTFTVSICTGEIGGESENCTSLLHYKIDDFCELHESNEAPLTESDVHFDKGGVYYTGWKNSSVSLEAYQGQLVTIKFAAGDVGDSIFDTAILLDDITQK